MGQLGYYTHYQEPEFRLLQLGVRFYDAEVGRFGQADIFASDDTSVYLYADGKPYLFVDPSGLKCHKVNPTDDSNYIGKCVNKARKCLPFSGGLALSNATLAKSEFYVCDGTNLDDANGDTRFVTNPWHWGLQVRIWPQNNNTDCGTVLHEIFHVFWWGSKRDHRGESAPFHGKIDNVAHNAWCYFCGDLCGKRQPANLYNDYLDVVGWPMIGPGTQ